MQFNATLKSSPADIILVSVFLSKSSAKETRSQMRGWTERRRKKNVKTKKCADVSALWWFKRWASSLSICIHINIHTVLPESNPVVVLRKTDSCYPAIYLSVKVKATETAHINRTLIKCPYFFLKGFLCKQQKALLFHQSAVMCKNKVSLPYKNIVGGSRWCNGG